MKGMKRSKAISRLGKVQHVKGTGRAPRRTGKPDWIEQIHQERAGKAEIRNV